MAARALPGVGPVLGHQGFHLGQLDDLPGLEAGVGARVEVGSAVSALGGAVVDHLVGARRHLRARAGAARLLSRTAAICALLAPLPLLGLALALSHGIPRRRQARVP